MKLADAIYLAESEHDIDASQFGPFASAHEGIATIRQKYLELEGAVFLNYGYPCRREEIRTKAIRLAAIALRFLVDLY